MFFSLNDTYFDKFCKKLKYSSLRYLELIKIRPKNTSILLESHFILLNNLRQKCLLLFDVQWFMYRHCGTERKENVLWTFLVNEPASALEFSCNDVAVFLIE